jgi:hypothetical protein
MPGKRIVLEHCLESWQGAAVGGCAGHHWRCGGVKVHFFPAVEVCGWSRHGPEGTSDELQSHLRAATATDEGGRVFRNRVRTVFVWVDNAAERGRA